MKKRGFGSDKYDKEKQRRVASLGGFMAHLSGKAHRFTSVEAKEASKKGLYERRKMRLLLKPSNEPYMNLIIKLRSMKN